MKDIQISQVALDMVTNFQHNLKEDLVAIIITTISYEDLM